jgi:hypothetical protein
MHRRRPQARSGAFAVPLPEFEQLGSPSRHVATEESRGDHVRRADLQNLYRRSPMRERRAWPAL